MLKFLYLVMIVVCQTGCACPQVHAGPPTPVTATLPPENASPSRVEVPVQVDVSHLVGSYVSSVPARISYDNWNGHNNTDQGFVEFVDGKDHYKVRLELILQGQPTYTLNGNVISYSFRFKYRLHGQRLFVFWLGGTCGESSSQHQGDVYAPQLNLVVEGTTALSIDERWHLNSSTSIHVSSIDPCVITLAGINVSGNLAPKLQGQIDGLLHSVVSSIDAKVGAIPFAQAIAQGWATLNNPISIGDGLSLAIRAKGLVLSPITSSGTTLMTTVGVIAEPIVGATQALPSGPAPALPSPSASTGGGFNITLPFHLPIATINERLHALEGREVSFAKSKVRIKSLSLETAGSGQLAVRMTFEGDGEHAHCGEIYLVGKPFVDAEKQSVTFPTLDFSGSTDSVIVDTIAWLKHSDIVDQLRTALVFSWSEALVRARATATDEARKTNVALDLRDVRVTSVEVGPAELLVNASVSGGATLVSPLLITSP